MAYPATITATDKGTTEANFNGFIINYYKGSPGKGTLEVGVGCSEQRAMEAGGAVTYVGADQLCQKVQGIRIIIGDTAESIHSGFELVNMNFHTMGTQSSFASNLNLGAPISA